MDNLNKLIKFQKELNNIDIENQLTVLQSIYKNIKYINTNDIITILDANVNELLTVYREYNHNLILSEKATPNKSNFFFCLYF
jgi:hypothetical protein